jgi:PAP2 superfamily
MPEFSQSAIRGQVSGAKGKKRGGPDLGEPKCPEKYDLRGPQVEPETSWWLHCLSGQCAVPRPPTEKELVSGLSGRGLLSPVHNYPNDPATLRREIQELLILARLRDEPPAIAHTPPPPKKEDKREPIEGLRLPLSMFLMIRPQPFGAVINTARDGASPVIGTGRELARYFESETPGLAHRLALDYMIREVQWAPPRQAWVWAALDVTIYSALVAAWYLKWRVAAEKRISFRPRPWECYHELDVLFDRLPNSTNSADAERRALPLGQRPNRSDNVNFTAWNPPNQVPAPLAREGEVAPPEAYPRDVIDDLPPSQPTPGTPRHPAYPSGHSTYSAAATRLLIEFFPRYREELCRLADNIGMARLWAGVHWRSDHTYGQLVGTAVAEMIIEQLRGSGIPRFPIIRPDDEAPPKEPKNPCEKNNWKAQPLEQLPPCCPRPEECGCAGEPCPPEKGKGG